MHDHRVNGSLFVSIVLDGVGIGAQPDAHRYGDADSHTLVHVCAAAGPSLPHLASLGLGHIDRLPGIERIEPPRASFGRMREVSAGKDSTSGHWELAGLRLDTPFPTYPSGFPPEVIEAFLDRTGFPGVLGNKPASGTTILDELGARHQETGCPIVYTSADSVFQLAAHVEIIPLQEIYRVCRLARDEVFTGRHAVGRVIARPFTGSPGTYQRLSAERKDYSLRPIGTTIQEVLEQHGVYTVSIGKVNDLFAGAGFDAAWTTHSNAEGIDLIVRQVKRAARSTRPSFIWANLVDFDQEYGHRNDPIGFARALEAFDDALPEILFSLPEGSNLAITADHGNDPTTPGTDHSREYVPILYYDGKNGRNLGERASFNDHAATIAAYFGVPFDSNGVSFLE